jgi:membrane protease YdiL (CAAX protease family)
MFIEQGIKKENDFWKYIIGSAVIILASFVGQIPLTIAVVVKSLKSGKMPTTNGEILSVLEPNLSLFLMMLSFVFAIAGIYLVVKYFHKQTFLSVTTSRSKVDWSRIIFSFLIWAAFTIISTLVMYYYSPEELVWNFKPIPFAILVVIGTILIPIQTSAEEYVFRGYLMQGFGIGSLQKKFLIGIFYTILFVPIYILFESIIESVFTSKISFLIEIIVIFLSILLLFLLDFALRKLNFFETSFYCKFYQISKSKFTPLIITSLIFGTMHIMNPEVEKMGYLILVYYIGTGMFLGVITLMDEGMELALGFHAANNLIGALLVTSDWSAFQTYSIFKDVSNPTAGF